MSGLDLTRLSDADLSALQAAGGDLSKLPDAALQSIKATLGGTQLYSPNPDAPTSYGGADSSTVTPQADFWTKAARVVGQGAQHFNDAVADTLLAIPDASAWVSRKTGLVPENTPSPSDVAKQGIDYVATLPGRVGDAVSTSSTAPLTDSRTSRFEPQGTAERLAGDIGGGVGSVFGSLVPLGLLNRTLGPAVVDTSAGATTLAPSRAAKVVDSLAANPGTQAASVVGGNVVADQTGDPRLGFVTSLGVPFGMQGANRVISAAPAATTQEAEHRALLEFGRQNNLGPLTAGKILDSKGLQTLESAASNSPVPLIGGRVAKTEAAGRNAFQRAAIEKAGTTGETAATPDVLARTRDRIGKNFDTLENGTTVNIDPQFGTDLAKARADFSQQLESQMPKSIMSKLDDLESAARMHNQPDVTGVTLDGTTYKNIRSKLSAQMAKTTGTDRQALGAMIDALDGAVERSLPADMVKDWQTARQQWRNYLALEKSVGANNADTAVGNMSTAAFGRAADGNPDLERLAQYGNKFVGDKAANTSRTAAHNIANHMMGLGGLYGAFEGLQHLGLGPLGAAGAVGSIALPPLAESALNNPATRAFLLSRYRNASPSMLTPGLFGAVAGQEASQPSR